MKILRRFPFLLLLSLLTAAPSWAQVGRCLDTTISATGRTLLSVPRGPESYASAGFTYRTTGSPGGVSIAIEAGNVLVATETPIEQIAAVTTTSGQVDMGAVPRNFRFWYANTATLSGGSSPTIVLTSCFSLNAFSVAAVGQAADGDPVLGYGVRITGKDSSGNVKDIATGSSGELVVASLNNAADGVSNGQLGKLITAGANPSSFLGVYPHLYNGSTHDRQRNNEAFAILASSARTAQTDSSDLTNFNNSGILLTVDISLDPGTASITPNIQSKDPVSGNYSIIWTAAAALTAVGTYTYLIYPGVLAADFDGTESASIAIPRIFRFRMAVADSESMTWSAGSTYVN